MLPVVREILDAYAAARDRRRATVDDDAHFHSGGVDAGLETAVVIEPTMGNQFVPLLRRHATLLARDLVLVGVRATCFFFGNLYFATVYVKSRERHQTQVANRVWLLIWMNAVPACLTLVIVVAINMETRMVKSEAKNGMVSPAAYLLARAALQVPLVAGFCLVALGVPGFAVANFTAKDGAFFTTYRGRPRAEAVRRRRGLFQRAREGAGPVPGDGRGAGRARGARDGADRVLGAEMAAVARGERAGRREAEAALAGPVRAVAAGRRLPADVQRSHLLRVAAAHGGRRGAVGRGPRGGREIRRGGVAVAREVARVLARVRVVEGEGVGAPPVELFPFVDRVDGGGDDGGEDGAAQDHAQQVEARPRPVVFSLDRWRWAQRQPLVFRVRRHPVGAGDHV